MPMYEYRTDDGEVVQRRFSMSDFPQQITLSDGRVAKKIISLTAKMASNWTVKDTDGSLPSESSRFLKKDEVAPEA
jgi:hypothetical protein